MSNNIFDFSPYPTPRTPTFSNQQEAPVPRIDGGGNYYCCYTCNMDLTRLEKDAVVRKEYEYEIYEGKTVVEKHFYTMSFCYWCAKRYLGQ